MIPLKLENLELWSCQECVICPTAIRQLMLTAPLTNLLFQSVSSLSDDLFLGILDDNPMLDLKSVLFDQCHGISVSTFTIRKNFGLCRRLRNDLMGKRKKM